MRSTLGCSTCIVDLDGRVSANISLSGSHLVENLVWILHIFPSAACMASGPAGAPIEWLLSICLENYMYMGNDCSVGCFFC